MEIVYIVAGMIFIIRGIGFLAHSTKKGNDVTQGKEDVWKGLLAIGVGAAIIFLGAAAYKQMVAVVDPKPGGTEPFLFNWINELLRTVTDGTGLPQFR